MARIPIMPVKVGRTGWYKSRRATPSDGACGVGTYPCLHPGIDLGAPRGTPVYAPEAGTIYKATAGTAPFGGYGPWVVLLHGNSGIYHLLAHLDASTASQGVTGTRVAEGQQIGTVSSANHTHWETRKKPVPDFAAGETNLINNIDPAVWFKQQNTASGGHWAVIGLLTAGAFVLWHVQSKPGV